MSSMPSFEHTIHVVGIRVRVTSDQSLSFLIQTLNHLESFSIFTKSSNCISLSMKHILEIFTEITEIMSKNEMEKMHKIMEDC